MLRSIPNLNVFRPADSEETLACYELALQNKKTPSALILSRQNLKFVTKDTQDYDKGAYVVSDCQNPDAVIIATGSELQIALDAKEILASKNIEVRIISMPCKEIFDKQEKNYQDKILGRDVNKKIIYCAIEAGVKQGWHEIIGNDGIFIGMNGFGASAPASDLFNHFEITSQKVVEEILGMNINNLKNH
jgi:transketolase